jgi:P2 family phage major capsid protein
MSAPTHLSAESRARLDQHFADTAEAFNVTPRDPSVGQHFSATPSVAQTVYEKIVEHGDSFLTLINVIGVRDIKGEKVGMSLSGRSAGRTNTDGGVERKPKHLIKTDSKGFELFHTEFDVALKYSRIDAWSKFKDFADKYMKMVRASIGDDMLQTGWTGISAETFTDLEANPLLQDLNKGWLQLLREFEDGQQYLKATAEVPIVLGSDSIKNLDVLVHQAKQMLPIYHRKRKDLVVIVGDDILSSQEETYFEVNGDTPTEKALLANRITKAYGNLPIVYAPFFPDGSLLVTPLNNLSIYFQDTSVRRLQKDKPELNEVQDFNSANQGYVVEDEEMAAFIEGITLA